MPEQLPTPLIVVLGLAGVLVIAVAGSRLARRADQLADVSGLGEARFGALLLGAGTSISGIVASVTAAHAGHAELAVGNALGGITVQTAFLAVADLAYRRANLEHAAASLENLVLGALLCLLLTLPLIGRATPGLTLGWVHPISPLLLLAYIGGLRLVGGARDSPLWRATRTTATRPDVPRQARRDLPDSLGLWVRFLGLLALVGAAGYLVARIGILLIARHGLSETLVGTLGTAVVTSLPELVTSVLAVRQGALTLAVGNIVGGNAFDVLFIALADLFYRKGSIYAAVSEHQLLVLGQAQLLTAVLLLGLLRRQRHGIANIGFESLLILAIYLGGVAVLMALD